MPSLVEFLWVGNSSPPKYVKYNVSVNFCSVPFYVHMPGAKTGEQICTIDGSKCVKSGKDVSFWGFVKKFSPHPQCPPNSKNLHYESSFRTKHI